MAGTTLPRPSARRETSPVLAARVLTALASPSDRSLLRARLEAAGLPVVAEAVDGAEVIALAASHRPSVVILEDDLPLRRGVDALPRVRRLVPHALICIWTADGASTADLARRSGADRVAGPDEVQALVAAVRDHFAIIL